MYSNNIKDISTAIVKIRGIYLKKKNLIHLDVFNNFYHTLDHLVAFPNPKLNLDSGRCSRKEELRRCFRIIAKLVSLKFIVCLDAVQFFFGRYFLSVQVKKKEAIWKSGLKLVATEIMYSYVG